MATLTDIGVAAAINILTTFAFFLVFAFLRLQPLNDRVYFPKWYLKGVRNSPTSSGTVTKFVNLDLRSYLRFLDWMPAALKMPEPELIDHAGLDSAIYLRIYLIGLKIFVPIAMLAFLVLVPVNWTNDFLDTSTIVHSNIDKLSISNIEDGSQRFWAHMVMAYVVTIWTCYVLIREYEIVASMRLHFLSSSKRRPDQFTVLVKNVPSDPDESISELVEHFFLVNHRDHYLTHQIVYNANKLTKLVEKKESLQNWLDYYKLKYERNPAKRPTRKLGFLGLFGKSVDAIESYTEEIEKLSKQEVAEREKIMNNPKSIIPAAFVSFNSRWGAAVCAQTQQTRNPTIWLTEWAPEPRDVYWSNLAIPIVQLTVRRLIIAVAFFFLTFFFMIPILMVQSIANIEGIEKVLSFLKPLIEKPKIKSLIQGFLPGIALKIFLVFLPTILMIMSKFEGFVSKSALERRAAGKYYLFLLVNVFLGSIVTGAAFEQLKTFLHQSASDIPITIGSAIPMKATFFISFIMVDGWAGIAGELLRLKPLVMYHLKNSFLVKTEKDREAAMDPGSIGFDSGEPRIQLYFLLGLVYAVVTPFLLPFIIIFFALAYVVFRHQIINVYNQEYESGAAFWPSVHGRIVTAMIISQLLLFGLISTKADSAQATPFLILLIALPVCTFYFHKYCKHRYEPAFVRYPLQEAMMRDTPFFFAGHDTTAYLLTWTVFLLSTNLEWQDKLRKEVVEECGMEIPNADNLTKFKSVTMVLYEALRLYGPVIHINRTAQQDMSIGKYKIPKGSGIVLPFAVIHRKEELWGANANEFDPMRFENGVTRAAKHPSALLAFGAGPRSCVGQNFAMMEAKIVIAMILQRFEFSVSPKYKHMPAHMLMLQPQNGLPIVFKPLLP